MSIHFKRPIHQTIIMLNTPIRQKRQVSEISKNEYSEIRDVRQRCNTRGRATSAIHSCRSVFTGLDNYDAADWEQRLPSIQDAEDDKFNDTISSPASSSQVVDDGVVIKSSVGVVTRSMARKRIAEELSEKDFIENVSASAILQKGFDLKSIEYIQLAKNRGTNLEMELLVAAMQGETERVELLHAAGGDINLKDDFGNTLLHLAAMRGHLELLNKLIEVDLNINELNNNCSTALHLASMEGHFEIVKNLVQSGAEINVFNNDYNTPVILSIIKSHKIIFDYLMDHNSNYHPGRKNDQANLVDIAFAISCPFLNHVKDRVGINQDALDEIEKVFSEIIGKQLNVAIKNGKKLVILLGEQHNNYKINQVKFKIFEIAKRIGIRTLLLEIPIGLESEAFDKTGTQFYKIAKSSMQYIKGIDNHPERNDPDCKVRERNAVMAQEMNLENEHLIFITGASHLQGLLNDPASRIDKEKFHIVPFNLSSLVSCEEISVPHDLLYKYLERKYPYNDLFRKFSTNPKYVIQISEDFSLSQPEFVVQRWNDVKLVSVPLFLSVKFSNNDLLFEDHIDMEICKINSCVILEQGLLFRLIELIKLAKSVGADLEKRLLEAIKARDSHSIKLLCKGGADVNKTYMGYTPLAFALVFDNNAALRDLLENGAEVNLEFKNGLTVLALAIVKSKIESIKILIEFGANAEKSMLDLARDIGNVEVIDCLSNFNKSDVVTSVELGSIFDPQYSTVTKLAELFTPENENSEDNSLNDSVTNNPPVYVISSQSDNNKECQANFIEPSCQMAMMSKKRWCSIQ